MERYRLAGVLALAGLLAAPLGAVAQSAPAGGHSEAGILKNMSKDVDAHIAQLHGQLEITPAEEPQWAAFAQVMRENAAQMDAAFSARGQTLPTMDAVENLQSYAQIAQIQSANMQKLAAAFQTLYASFPEAQRKVADGVFRGHEVKR